MSKVKLSNIIDIISGGTPKTSIKEYWENGTIGWLSVTDFNDNLRFVYDTEKKITEAGLKNSNTKLLQKSDLIISARGTVGALAQIGTPMCFNQSCFGLRGKKNIADNDFLYYCLKNYVSNIKRRSQGSVFDTINLNSFDLMEIDIPEFNYQKKIASVLSSLDSKIELNNKINFELEQISKTLYDYWFVQFDFPDKNGKPYKTSGGKMVYNEELKREIPEGWEVKKLGEFCDIYQPQTISDKDCMENGEYFVHGSNGIIGKYDKYNHEESEIVVSCRGDCGNIHRTLPKVWITGNAMVFKLKDKSIHNEFLYQALNYSGIKNISSGSVQGQITRTNVSPLKIIIPEKNIINKFSEISESIVTKKLLIQEENQKLAELRDWLLPMLMNGQVKVR